MGDWRPIEESSEVKVVILSLVVIGCGRVCGLRWLIWWILGPRVF